MTDGRLLGLEPIDPPAGGLAKLRRRIERRERRGRIARRSIGLTATAAMLAFTALLFRGVDPPPSPALPEGDGLLAIRLGLSEPPGEIAVVSPERRETTALRRVPTRDERVALYWVGSISNPG